jgi:hypothetical protein
MTASQIAHQLHGKKAGSRYMCRCPTGLHAHGDRNRSLSVGEKNGWVTLKCFTGCTRDEILAAMGLKIRDLALDEMPDPKALALAEKKRAQEKYRRKAAHLAWRRALDQAWFWRNRRDELGRMLAEDPENCKIASLFHAACSRFQTASAAELSAREKDICASGKKFNILNEFPMD